MHLGLLNERYAGEHRPQVVSFETDWPLEIQERVLDRWADYGYVG